MWRKLQRQVAVTREELHELLGQFAPLLEQTAAGQQPDRPQTLALAAFLGSFYNGAENIFKRIALLVDGRLPSGPSWHAELLSAMARPGANRPRVLSEGLRERLKGYLDCRHHGSAVAPPARRKASSSSSSR